MNLPGLSLPTITGNPLQGCDIGVRGKQNKKPKKPSKKRHSDHLQFSGTFSHTASWDSRSPTLIVSHCIATCCFIPSVFAKWEVQKEQLCISELHWPSPCVTHVQPSFGLQFEANLRYTIFCPIGSTDWAWAQTWWQTRSQIKSVWTICNITMSDQYLSPPSLTPLKNQILSDNSLLDFSFISSPILSFTSHQCSQGASACTDAPSHRAVWKDRGSSPPANWEFRSLPKFQPLVGKDQKGSRWTFITFYIYNIIYIYIYIIYIYITYKLVYNNERRR